MRSCRSPLRQRRFDAAPERHRQLTTFEMLYLVYRESGRSEPLRHHLIFETEANMGVPLAELFALMCGKINDEKRSAWREHAPGFRDRCSRRMRIMENLVDDDRVGAVV